MNKLTTKIANTNTNITFFDDRFIGSYLKSTGYWEPELSQLLVEKFKYMHDEEFIFLDIGAHVGYFSLLCATYCPKSTIIAFEPVKHIYKVLCENIKQFPLHKIKLYNAGILDQPRKSRLIDKPKREHLSCSTTNSGNNSIYYDEIEKDATNGGDLDQTDEIVNLYDIRYFNIDWDKVGFVKIDTQGNEGEIFKQIYDIIMPLHHGRKAPTINRTTFIIEDGEGIYNLLLKLPTSYKRILYDVIFDL